MSLFLTVVALIVAAGAVGIAWRAKRGERLRSEARVAALSGAIDPPRRDGAPPFLVSGRSAHLNASPLVKVALGFAAVVTLIVGVAMTNDLRDESRGARPETAETPLALLSMRHERSADSLTVTGLVRNQSRVEADGIVAVIFAFDKSGRFIASARAPLDLGALGPGDESPFRVAVPHVSDVGRYRVSFRTESGLVRHVDRRSQASRNLLAAGAEPLIGAN